MWSFGQGGVASVGYDVVNEDPVACRSTVTVAVLWVVGVQSESFSFLYSAIAKVPVSDPDHVVFSAASGYDETNVGVLVVGKASCRLPRVSNNNDQCPSSGLPTPGTAPAPAPAPFGDWCFSGESLVVTVQNNEVMTEKTASTTMMTIKRMDQLKLGDWVLTSAAADNDKSCFAEVYSFGHYNPNVETEYLQIYTKSKDSSPLEITSNHLLYRYNDNAISLVPAGNIRVGDTLVAATSTNEESQAAATVQEIRKVTRTGAYSPLTTTGIIVVSSILSSNYVWRDWLKEDWVLGGPIMLHYLQHGAAVPYRVYCAMVDGCQNETYNDTTGFSPWVMFWYRIEQWQVGLHPILQGLFLMVLAVPVIIPVLVGMLLMTPIRSTGASLGIALGRRKSTANIVH